MRVYETNKERELVCYGKVIKSRRNYYKVKILQDQDEFEILTKDSLWNIEKKALKGSNILKEIMFK